MTSFRIIYGKCPKILNTKVSDKMTVANSADPDQTASASVCHSAKYLKKQLQKKTKFRPK